MKPVPEKHDTPARSPSESAVVDDHSTTAPRLGKGRAFVRGLRSVVIELVFIGFMVVAALGLAEALKWDARMVGLGIALVVLVAVVLMLVMCAVWIWRNPVSASATKAS